jgi:hypothetical protein
VKDDFRSVKDAAQIFLSEIEVAKGESSRRPRARKILFLEPPRGFVPEAIDPDDIVAVGKQTVAQVRTDESRRSRDYRANWLTCLV